MSTLILRTPQQLLDEKQLSDKRSLNLHRNVSAPNMIQQKRVVTSSVNNSPAPQIDTFQPDNTRFEYKEGMGAVDIINQANRQKTTLVDQEKRAQTAAKVAAFTDFFKALGGLAGGGYATPQQYQPSPYLTRAFGEIDRIRSDKNRAEMYYDELLRKTKQDDYNTQLKYHNAAQAEKNRYASEAVKEKNKAAIEAWKANTGKVTEEWQDPTKQNKELELKERQLGISQQNANANTMRAAKYGDSKAEKEAEKNKPIATIKRADGKVSTITKSQAEKMVRQAKIDYKTILDNEEFAKTDDEKALLKVIREADMNPTNLSKAASMLMRTDKKGRYRGYYVDGKSSDVAPVSTQPKGSFLPSPSKKTSLLP